MIITCKPHGVNLIGATEFRHAKSARPKKHSMCTRPFPPFGGGVWARDYPSIRLSVCPYGKGRLRESTHLRIIGHQGRVVTLSPAQWYNSVQLWLPFCALLVSCPCSDSVNRQWLSSAYIHVIEFK